MIQVLLNNLVRILSPHSYILFNIQIPPLQLIRFSYLLEYSHISRGCPTRCKEKTGVSSQLRLMMKRCRKLCDAFCRPRFNQITLRRHQRLNYLSAQAPPNTTKTERGPRYRDGQGWGILSFMAVCTPPGCKLNKLIPSLPS
jgi:hypothetical protein